MRSSNNPLVLKPTCTLQQAQQWYDEVMVAPFSAKFDEYMLSHITLTVPPQSVK